MRFVVLKTIKFIVAFFCCTVVCTILWQGLVTGRIYDCTDPGWLDYLFPGTWVHSPVTVAHVVVGRSMSEPDTIKAGWSIAGLWLLWLLFFGASVFVSVLLTRIEWLKTPSSSPPELINQNHFD
jgi:hypothetical protein